MVAKGQSAIWRDGAEPTTEVGTEDIIQFMDDAVVNSAGSIVNTSFNITTGIARNERPGALDKLQDTGTNGITITVTGNIIDQEGNGKKVEHKFKEWLLEPKTVTSTFPKGRFGLRLNDFPVFNMTPNTVKGYMLESIEMIRDGETKGKISFIAVLRFNGDETNGGNEPNGSGQYEW